MKKIFYERNLLRIRTFLKKYSTLIFWLAWGIIIGLIFGFILKDFRSFFLIFIGYGIFLGITFQFIKVKWLRRAAVSFCVIIALYILWKPVVSFTQIILNQKISRNFLVDDIRQLAAILEVTHPDPYFHGGGKVVFNRRMQDLIRTIPVFLEACLR